MVSGSCPPGSFVLYINCEGPSNGALMVTTSIFRPSRPPPPTHIQRFALDTNMNQFNQVTVPQLAFMNAIMAAMQTQPQAQLQSAGGVPNAINGPTMPQQPAAFPNFLLQVPQLQAIPGSSSVPQLPVGGQPWMLPALHIDNAPQPSGSQSAAGPSPKQPITAVDEIVAGVVAAMKSRMPQEVSENSLSKFAPDDERVLVNALRKAKVEGLSPLQGISKLDQVSRLTLSFRRERIVLNPLQVNNHTAAGQSTIPSRVSFDSCPILILNIAAWKDYFIKYVERLGPKVYPQAYPNPAASASSKSAAGGSRYDLHACPAKNTNSELNQIGGSERIVISTSSSRQRRRPLRFRTVEPRGGCHRGWFCRLSVQERRSRSGVPR